MDLDDAEGLAAMGAAGPVMNPRDIVPHGQDFATVGHLYRSIESGFHRLTEKYGEDWLFTGPKRAQAAQQHFGWPELVPVTGLATAQRAIEEILEQGEGPRGHWRDAHFGQFVAILDEYQQLREAGPGLDPVRPVLAANVRPHERLTDFPLITDPLTARVTDLFNVGYEILLQILERFFAHTSETDPQLKVLADATIGLMLNVIKPLGSLITTLPVGPEHPGATAGPSFELFYETDYVMPHRQAAWALLAERLDEAAWLCSELCAGRGAAVSAQLEPVLAAIREIAAALAAHLPAGSPQSKIAKGPPGPRPADIDALARKCNTILNAVAGAASPGERTRAAAELAAAVHTIEATGTGPSRGRSGDAAGRPGGGSGSAAERLWEAVLAATRSSRPACAPGGSGQSPDCGPSSPATHPGWPAPPPRASVPPRSRTPPAPLPRPGRSRRETRPARPAPGPTRRGRGPPARSGLHHRPHLYAAPVPDGRDARREFDRLVQVGCLDDEYPAEHFFGVCERAVGHQRPAAGDPHAGRRLGRLQLDLANTARVLGQRPEFGAHGLTFRVRQRLVIAMVRCDRRRLGGCSLGRNRRRRAGRRRISCGGTQLDFMGHDRKGAPR